MESRGAAVSGSIELEPLSSLGQRIAARLLLVSMSLALTLLFLSLSEGRLVRSRDDLFEFVEQSAFQLADRGRHNEPIAYDSGPPLLHIEMAAPEEVEQGCPTARRLRVQCQKDIVEDAFSGR